MRDKALVAFMASTCIAEGSIPHLTFRNVEPEWQTAHPHKLTFDEWMKHFESTELPYIKIVGKVLPDGNTTLKGGGQGKYAGVQQHTFMTPEAKTIMIQYLRWRVRTRGKPKLDDPLFIVLTRKPQGSALQVEAVKTSFNRISKNNPSSIHFSAHDMRRFVENALEEARIHPNRCKKIRGRKVRGEEAPYSQPSIAQLRNDYSRAVKFLRFTEKTIARIEDAVAGAMARYNLLMSDPNITPEQKEKAKKMFLENLTANVREEVEKRVKLQTVTVTERNGGSYIC